MKPRSSGATPPRATLRTWSHLEAGRRVPSEYELVTSKLLYYPSRGFEVDVPLGERYRRYQQGSALRASDWDRFVDPRRTTYARYTQIQSGRESHVGALLERIEQSGYDAALPAEARRFLDEIIAPLRFPVHGLQMLAAYVGEMAPGGRIVIAAALQAADELRRLQRIAYRVALMRRTDPACGSDGRARWEKGEAWQPLREVIERLLVVFDWGEAFAALNLCLKPLFDTLVHAACADEARRRGDYLLGEIFASLDEDARWHRAWSAALVSAALADRPDNREALRGWIERHAPPAARAVAALGRSACAEPAGERLARALDASLAALDLGFDEAPAEAREELTRWR